MCAGGLQGSGSSFRRADGTFAGQGTRALEAVGMVWLRDVIPQAGGVGPRDGAQHFDSNLPAEFSSAWGADVACSACRFHRFHPLSDRSAAVIATN